MDSETVKLFVGEINQCKKDIKDHINAIITPMGKLIDGHLKWHEGQRKQRIEQDLIRQKFYKYILAVLICASTVGLFSFVVGLVLFWIKIQLGINGN